MITLERRDDVNQKTNCFVCLTLRRCCCYGINISACFTAPIWMPHLVVLLRQRQSSCGGKKKNSRICLSSSLRHKTGVLTFFWFNPSCTSAGEPPRTGTQEVLEVKVPVSAGASSSWRLAAQTEQSQAEPDDCCRAVDTKNSETFIKEAFEWDAASERVQYHSTATGAHVKRQMQLQNFLSFQFDQFRKE